HEVWTRADNGRLYRAPISSDANILDLGTGSGEWANELADNNGSCKVLGIDICPMQPNLVNPRVQFMLENFDSPEYEEPQRRYDYIHARDLAGSVTDWPELLGKAFRATRPGGWVEIGQVDINPETNGELDPNLGWWVENIIHAGERSKKSFDICGRLEGWVKGAGFVNVKKIIIPVQVGCIPDDMDQLGKLNQERFLKELDGHSYRPLIGTLGMNANRVQAALVGVRQAIKGAQNVQHNL
ncbi:S-adenosyl-L-methionine-dependent methyltransferase, partial [Cadophora sp. MPI-SDFR-AT-0126]